MIKLEKERRWLLKYLPDQCWQSPVLYITQYYKNGERARAQHNQNGVKYVKNIKTKLSPGINQENESEMTEQEFYDFCRDAERVITKRRYLVPAADGGKWEVDEFFGMKIVIAEIELPELDRLPEMPSWLKEAVACEITGIDELSNYQLSASVDKASNPRW